MQEQVLWPPAAGTEISMTYLIEVSCQLVGTEWEGERDSVRERET